MNNERLAAIKNYGVKKEQKQIEQEKKFKTLKKERIAEIKKKQPLIKDLIETANACVDAGIHLGPIIAKSNWVKPQFITDGITHDFGFQIELNDYCIKHNNPTPKQGGYALAIGMVGSGCAGDSFLVNEFGIIVKGLDEPDLVFMRKSKEFLDNIDSFALSFYNYVDKITKTTTHE